VVEFPVIRQALVLGKRAIYVSVFLAVGAVASAQNIQLSPAQQQMLNQLPPAQRQQAIDAMRQLQAQQAMGTQRSINEPVEPVENGINYGSVDRVIAASEVTAHPRTRLILNFEPRVDLDAAQMRQLTNDPALQKLIGSHIFVLMSQVSCLSRGSN
jgi:hypothetical protein